MKALSLTRARVIDPLNYSLRDQKISEGSCCKYLGITIRRDLSWGDQVNYTVHKAWRALHFVMHVVKKGEIKYEKCFLHVSSTSDSEIWGCVLVSLKGMSDRCCRAREKQGG
jgi:hypothetical protein